jgi:arsenate reductase
MSDKPSVLFVCVHNAGRSQMAAGWLRHLAGDAVEVRSAGSAPAETINPPRSRPCAEVGIDITDQTPKLLEYETAQDSDVIITMGCGDACPIFPGKRYEDWKLDDPAGQGVDAVRPIRDEIKGPDRGAAGRPDPGRVERHVAPGHHPLLRRLVRGRAGVGHPRRVLRVPGAQDVEAAALGDLEHRLPGRDLDVGAFGQDAEVVRAGHRRAVDGQFLAVGQGDGDPVRAGRPGSGRVREPLRGAVQPVQAGDRQEAVRGGALLLVLGVPLVPLLCEGRHSSTISLLDEWEISMRRGSPRASTALHCLPDR